MGYPISQDLLVQGLDLLNSLFIFLISILQHPYKHVVVWKCVHYLLSSNLATVVSDQKSPIELCTSSLHFLYSLLKFFSCAYGKLSGLVDPLLAGLQGSPHWPLILLLFPSRLLKYPAICPRNMKKFQNFF